MDSLVVDVRAGIQ